MRQGEQSRPQTSCSAYDLGRDSIWGVDIGIMESSPHRRSDGGAHEKLGPALRTALSTALNDEVTRFHVMISFRGPLSVAEGGRHEEMVSRERMRRAFEEQARPVNEELIASGGQNVEFMWIARALTARASRAGLLRVARHSEVTRIDLVEPKKALI